MQKKCLAAGKRRNNEDNRDEALAKKSEAGLGPGDVTWIKLRGNSWWPAQVVDENFVSDSNKPRKGKNCEVLVRLYGTYEYSYVNPVTTHSEFDNVLKRHKGSHKEIIQKGLKQDSSESRSGRSKTRNAKAKDVNAGQNGSVVKKKAVRDKKAVEKADVVNKRLRANSPSSDFISQKTGGSARRLKVMQVLGLSAPSGSPFFCDNN